MIEIIREEDWDRTTKALPKDIKQIGRPDIGDRIYVEDQVYHFLHPYENRDEKTAYVLLGRFENYAGRQCTFIEAAIKLEEIAFEGELPLWDDHTWAYIYKQLKHEYDSMVIVGWAMDIRGQLPNLTARIEALHQSNFGGVHQVLFLMDTLEGEEAFYSDRNGHLSRREGFYIYFDKKIPEHLNTVLRMLEKEKEENGLSESPFGQGNEEPVFESEHFYAGDTEKDAQQLTEDIRQLTEDARQTGPEEETHSDAVGMLRQRLKERGAQWIKSSAQEENTAQKEHEHRGNYRKQVLEREEKPQAYSYASSFLLLTVVCVLGATAYLNYQKMNAMEETIAQMNGVQAATEQPADAESSSIKIESVAGNVQKQEAVQSGTPEAPADPSAVVDPSAAPENTGADPAAGTDSSAAPENTGADPAAGTDSSADPGNTGTDPAAGTDSSADPGNTGTDPSGNPPAAPENAGTDSPADPAMTEAQTCLAQGYYIVKKGDSLVGICRKIYQTTAMMDKLCEINGIENQDSIYAGQYLTLPN